MGFWIPLYNSQYLKNISCKWNITLIKHKNGNKTELKKGPLPVSVIWCSQESTWKAFCLKLADHASNFLHRFPKISWNFLNGKNWETQPWSNRRMKNTKLWGLKEQRRVKHSSMINSSLNLAPRNLFHKEFIFTIWRSSMTDWKQNATNTHENDRLTMWWNAHNCELIPKPIFWALYDTCWK